MTRPDAWAGYWSRGEAGAGGCIPDAPPQIEALLDRLWTEFARALPKGGAVLDLATGNGTVLRRIAARRRDLKLTGIDASPSLPPAPPGIRFLAGTAMEALPFPDGSFEAVTSQFGFEYGDPERIVRELVRVLKGGTLRFLIHHEASVLVRHNAARRRALAWAARESGLLNKARNLASARKALPLPTPTLFRLAISEARSRFPGQPVATEFVTAIAQSLELGARRPPAETLQVLDSLAAKSSDEIGRIDALERSAIDAEGVGSIAEMLRAAGFAADVRQVDEPGGGPFAWLVDARLVQTQA